MKLIKSMTGYKATDKDMTCKGHKFELGKWYEVAGELKECENGFHFCEQPSGVWCYYPDTSSRVFKIEAEDVLDTIFQPGTFYKRVCRRIKLIEEVSKNGHRNTGDGNTGDCNTGNRNTGSCNTGHRNTGSWNTGHRNTGDWNTGHRNTGDGNTGSCNTGHRNTGDGNTGDGNTGSWNLTNFSSGYLCIDEPKLMCFDEIVEGYSRGEFLDKFGYSISRLFVEAKHPDKIDFEKYKDIPNITPEKLEKYHQKMLSLQKPVDTTK